MASSQAISCRFTAIAVTTDRKYVKNGITEWIKEWKLNELNTTKRKGDRDILNKDLWLILDYLREQLTVEWRWVEGHKDSEGNKKADDLARVGISAETTFWQDTAFRWYEEQCCDITNMTVVSVASKGQEENIMQSHSTSASLVTANEVRIMTLINVKNASSGCTTDVLTYLSISYIHMNVLKENLPLNFVLTLMQNFQKASRKVRTHPTQRYY